MERQRPVWAVRCGRNQQGGEWLFAARRSNDRNRADSRWSGAGERLRVEGKLPLSSTSPNKVCLHVTATRENATQSLICPWLRSIRPVRRRDHLLVDPDIVSGVRVQEQGCTHESVLQKQARTFNIVVPDSTLQDAASVFESARGSCSEKCLCDPPPTIVLVDSEVIDLRLIPLNLFHFDATDDLIILHLEQKLCARSEDGLGVVVYDELIASVEQGRNLSGVVLVHVCTPCECARPGLAIETGRGHGQYTNASRPDDEISQAMKPFCNFHESMAESASLVVASMTTAL